MGKPVAQHSSKAPSTTPSKQGTSPSIQGGAVKKTKKKQKTEPALQAAAVTAPESASTNPKKKAASEIDDIFGGAKAQQQAAEKHGESNKQPQATKSKVVGSKDDIFGETTGSRKKTEEGYNIYTEDELGLGAKGGDTDLCPFDCSCCF